MYHEIADLIFEKDEQLNQLDTTEIWYTNKVVVIEANFKAKVDAIINREKYGLNNNE